MEDDVILKTVKRIANKRSSLIDSLLILYLLENKVSASQVELIEEETEKGLKWYFKKRNI